MSKLEVDKIDPQSGTDLELGSSGDTITIPTGVTFDSSAATNTLPSTVVTTTGTQTLTNKSIAATQLTGTITPSDGTVTTAKLADNAVTLAKMASGTDGNIISYDASGNPVAVATGSAGQVLTSAGAGAPPTFAAASSDFVKISTTTVSSGVASVSLTGMNSTYKNYKIIVNDIEQASHSNGYFRFINASGDITSSAYYGAIAGAFNPYNSGVQSADVGDYNIDHGRVTNFDFSTNASHASSFEMLIPNPSNSATYPYAYGQSFTNSQNGSYVISQIFGYTHTTASIVTGIKFYINDGSNIDGGNFSLYGIKG